MSLKLFQLQLSQRLKRHTNLEKINLKPKVAFKKNSLQNYFACLCQDNQGPCSTKEPFGTIQSLISHIQQTHSVGKIHTCIPCEDIFPTQKALKTHKANLCSLNLHKCELCTLRFQTSTSLEKHKRGTHAVSKSHYCTMCGKTFSSKVTCKF